MTIEKYLNEDGDVGVLVSYGYGAGWSTWGDDKEFLAMDKTLIELKLKGASIAEVEGYIKGAGRGDQYMGGWSDCEVEYLKKGTAFTISEYDGSEDLETIDTLTLTA